MNQSPLIAGFCAGILEGLDEELAAMEAATLTQTQSGNRLMPSAAEIRELAGAYSCSSKTLARMLKRGIDITNPEAVAVALAGQKNVSAAMLEAVVERLESENAISNE